MSPASDAAPAFLSPRRLRLETTGTPDGVLFFESANSQGAAGDFADIGRMRDAH